MGQAGKIRLFPHSGYIESVHMGKKLIASRYCILCIDVGLTKIAARTKVIDTVVPKNTPEDTDRIEKGVLNGNIIPLILYTFADTMNHKRTAAVSNQVYRLQLVTGCQSLPYFKPDAFPIN